MQVLLARLWLETGSVAVASPRLNSVDSARFKHITEFISTETGSPTIPSHRESPIARCLTHRCRMSHPGVSHCHGHGSSRIGCCRVFGAGDIINPHPPALIDKLFPEIDSLDGLR